MSFAKKRNNKLFAAIIFSQVLRNYLKSYFAIDAGIFTGNISLLSVIWGST